jgi:Flp pilus assembly pilin Flp
MYRLQVMTLSAIDRLGLRLRDQRGQGTMEYVLIIAVLVVAILAILFAFRDRLQGWIDTAAGTIDGWMT